MPLGVKGEGTEWWGWGAGAGVSEARCPQVQIWCISSKSSFSDGQGGSIYTTKSSEPPNQCFLESSLLNIYQHTPGADRLLSVFI